MEGVFNKCNQQDHHARRRHPTMWWISMRLVCPPLVGTCQLNSVPILKLDNLVRKPRPNHEISIHCFYSLCFICLIDRVDINDPHVIDTGNFAVTKHNKQNNETKLIFEKVIDDVVDIVNDKTKYRLTLSANNGSTSNNYEIIVLDKPLEHLRNLTAFALISRA
ncbi:cystatin domain protein [Medicago truncatula]|uniref:Cystatin domain protein n=1 Tax=Medicago truncatula TaxID=3880 RepID=G7KKS4_MEDTR|nr:cystatin domain protein [Medicago truncatula]